MASLFAALNVAVGGLSAQSQALGNISDDLSNAQTTGFKTIGTSFQDLVTASSATSNSPGGVQAIPQYENNVQGTIAASATSTNLAISGQGFFQVQSATQSATGATVLGSTYYTRQGDFTENANGYLVNSSGYYLDGWALSTSGTKAASTTPIQISGLLDSPVATTSSTFAANLPAGAAVGYTSTPSTVEIYDAEGQTHTMSLTWTKTGTNAWAVEVDVADGAGTNGSDYTATIPVTFNSATNVGTMAALGTAGSSGASGTYTVDPVATDAGATIPLTFAGEGPQSIDLNFGAYNQATGVTQFADSSGIVSVSSFQQNGLSKGSFSGIGIDANGIVSINYSNGSVREIYQIPIAMFNSPDNLQRISGGAYQATLASGTLNLYDAGTTGAGTVASSSLESSTVDIATEFTNLITSQQVYSANAKIVTTINQMLNTIIQAVQ
ncbi:MAG: flagellar hook protein FlgE [Alphaproteobacteria bacterium]